LETIRRASPPEAGTVHRSPPETKTISRRSGEKLGSEKEGRGAGSSTDEFVGLMNAALASAITKRESGRDIISGVGKEREQETL
jgi:hypothetical protein